MQIKIYKYVALFLIFALCQVTFANFAAAQDDTASKKDDPKADSELEGRVFDTDQKTLLKSGDVRITNLETGESETTEVNDNGRFCFDDLLPGTYSIAYSRSGADFLLPDKIALAEKTVVATCVAVTTNNALMLMTDKDADDCRCKKGLPIGYILLGAAAAIAIGIAIGGGEEPEASPSQP